jgi:DNA-binding IclR family transcriptional regulator
MTEPSYPVGSVDRALRLLLLLGERSSLRLSDAANDLGVANSTAHRLLAMLVKHEFAIHEPGTADYTAGEAFARLRRGPRSDADLLALATPFIRRLSSDLAETTNIAVLRGRDVLFLGGAQCDQLVRVDDRAGELIPAFRSACGKVLLAQLDDHALAALFPEDVLADAGGWTVSGTELRRELVQIRRDGWSKNESSDSVVSFAVPLRRRAEVMAALGVIAPVARASRAWRSRALAALTAAASELESHWW